MTARFALPLITIVLPALFFAQIPGDGPVDALIRSLGSAGFQERQAAAEALKKRPEAAPALREALKSPDPEVRARAASILEYHERRPIRELHETIKDGRINAVIEKLAACPAGISDAEAWLAVRATATALGERYGKKMGRDLDPLKSCGDAIHTVCSKRITEETVAPSDRAPYFLRAEQVNIDHRRGRNGFRNNELEHASVVVAAGAVYLKAAEPLVILATGAIEIAGGDGCANAIILSGGDIDLDCDLDGCLVVARGKVNCTGIRVVGSLIISGKSANVTPSQTNTIIENESNPLGFIRWAEAPKKNAPANGK